MAIAAKVGALAAKTSTGTQDYTGFGFQPEAMLFGPTFLLDAAGTSADAVWGFGGGGSSSRSAVYGLSADNLATANVGTVSGLAFGYSLTPNSATRTLQFTYSTFLADGIRLSFIVADGTARRLPYLGLDGVTVGAGTFESPTTVGDTSISGLGFRPEVLLIFKSTSGTGLSDLYDLSFSWGIANAYQQSCVMNAARDSAGTSITKRGLHSNRVLWCQNPEGTDRYVANLTSFDSDGFTIAFSTVTGSTEYFSYIAFKAASGTLRSYIGGFAQPTSTGTQAIGIDGCNPVAYMVGGVGAADSLTSTTHARWMLGASDGTSQWAHWAGDQHGADTTVSDTALSEAKVAVLYTEGTPALVTDAAHSAMTSGSVTLNWTTVDATAREQLLIALGNDAAGYYPWPATLLFRGYAPTKEFTYYTPQTSTPTVATVRTVAGTPTVTRQLAALVTAAALTFTGAAPTITARQAAHPTSDVAAGTWTPSTGTDLYAMVDEADTPDDNDYITSGVDPVDDTAVLGLGALGIPTTGTVTIRLRHKLVT